MRSGRERVLILFSVFILAGCFQQAGESLRTTGITSAPAQNCILTATDSVATDTLPTETEAFVIPSDTPAELVIEASPTTEAPTELAAVGTPTAPPITIIVPATMTNVPPVTATSEIGEATEDNFITPGSPVNPNVIMNTATPAGGALTSTPSGLVTPTAPTAFDAESTEEVTDECLYEVEPGDTVYRIAVLFETNVNAMREANPELTGENPVIHPGDTLIIPNCEADETADTEAEVSATPSATNVPSVISPSGQTPTALDGEYYIVRPGDTLAAIAARYGTTVRAIVDANELSNPDRLSIGQELFIPNP